MRQNNPSSRKRSNTVFLFELREYIVIIIIFISKRSSDSHINNRDPGQRQQHSLANAEPKANGKDPHRWTNGTHGATKRDIPRLTDLTSRPISNTGTPRRPTSNTLVSVFYCKRINTVFWAPTPNDKWCVWGMDRSTLAQSSSYLFCSSQPIRILLACLATHLMHLFCCRIGKCSNRPGRSPPIW